MLNIYTTKLDFISGSVGTRDAIRLMRIISERMLDAKGEMCLRFIDWQRF